MRALWVALFSLSALLAACGGYAEGTAGARSALVAGRARDAEVALTQAIEEGERAARPLLLLERAVARQRLGEHLAAARDLQEADERLEVLDYTSATAQEVSRYLFSDDSAPYRAQPFEKILVNLLGVASRLAGGEASAAQVEARRLQVYLSYAEERRQGSASLDAALSALTPLCALVRAAAFAAGGDRAAGAQAARAGGEPLELIAQRLELPTREGAEVLVLTSAGLVPHKRGVRVPLASALVYMDSQGGLTPEERQRARVIYAQGAVKWLNFVELVSERSAQPSPGLAVRSARQQGAGQGSGQGSGQGGRAEPLASAPLDALTRQAFELAQPKILTSALTRLLTRAAAGAASRQLVGRASGGIAGLLVGLATEGAMSAADTPDTRSWTSLPARLDAYWLHLPEGDAELSWGGQTRRVALKRGEVRVVMFPER